MTNSRSIFPACLAAAAQNHVDGLLLGIADESAGVDHHRLGVGAVAVEHDFVTGRRKAGHQVLRIDRIL